MLTPLIGRGPGTTGQRNIDDKFRSAAARFLSESGESCLLSEPSCSTPADATAGSGDSLKSAKAFTVFFRLTPSLYPYLDYEHKPTQRTPPPPSEVASTAPPFARARLFRTGESKPEISFPNRL